MVVWNGEALTWASWIMTHNGVFSGMAMEKTKNGVQWLNDFLLHGNGKDKKWCLTVERFSLAWR
jgi:hypothetical protein